LRIARSERGGTPRVRGPPLHPPPPRATLRQAREAAQIASGQGGVG
jgi:hypothetical protein